MTESRLIASGTPSEWRCMVDSRRSLKVNLGYEALASLVRSEFPPDLTLAEIAQRWGTDLSPAHISALAFLEGESAEPPAGVGEHAPNVAKVQL